MFSQFVAFAFIFCFIVGIVNYDVNFLIGNCMVPFNRPKKIGESKYIGKLPMADGLLTL